MIMFRIFKASISSIKLIHDAQLTLTVFIVTTEQALAFGTFRYFLIPLYTRTKLLVSFLLTKNLTNGDRLFKDICQVDDIPF